MQFHIKEIQLLREQVKELLSRVQVLENRNKNLEESNRVLLHRNQELERSQKLDSSNSSKPPSSDGLKKKKRTQSLRKKSDRSPGGQIGHPGVTLCQSPNPDEIIECSPSHCPHCNCNLEEVRVLSKHEKRQVFDLPEFNLKIKSIDC